MTVCILYTMGISYDDFDDFDTTTASMLKLLFDSKGYGVKVLLSTFGLLNLYLLYVHLIDAASKNRKKSSRNTKKPKPRRQKVDSSDDDDDDEYIQDDNSSDDEREKENRNKTLPGQGKRKTTTKTRKTVRLNPVFSDDDEDLFD